MRLQDEGYSARVEFQGNRLQVKVRRPYIQPAMPPDENRRGEINGFSRKSRKRLLDFISSIDWKGQKAVFVTLTYPREFPKPKDAKNHLRAFMERVRRRFPQSSAIWRMEFQKRGAPHFHLIFFNMPYWDKKSLQVSWGEIIGYESPFTRIELIKSWRKAMSYVSKYIAKEDSRDSDSGFNYLPYLHAGRVWGFFQKDKIPFAALIIVSLPLIDRQFYQFRRYAKRFWRGVKRQGIPAGWTIYHEDMVMFRELLALSHALPV